MSKSKRAAANGKPARPGPKPEYLKIEGDWEEAIKKAMQKKKPKGGWPK